MFNAKRIYEKSSLSDSSGILVDCLWPRGLTVYERRYIVSKQITLDEKELKMISEILKFSEGACPVESVDPDFAVDAEKIKALLSKLEKA